MEVVGQVGFEQVPGGFFHRCFQDDVLGAFRFDAREAEFFAKLFQFHDADELLGGNGNGTIATFAANYLDVMGATGRQA